MFTEATKEALIACLNSPCCQQVSPDLYEESCTTHSCCRGTMVANGVVASAHSDWYLDATFNAFGVHGWLPGAYQVQLFLPGMDASVAKGNGPTHRPQQSRYHGASNALQL